jgi:hypothetical protein
VNANNLRASLSALTPCPSCGRRGMHRRIHPRCRWCSHEWDEPLEGYADEWARLAAPAVKQLRDFGE